MKNLLCILMLATLAWSCTPDQLSPAETGAQKPTREAFRELDLSAGGLPLALRVPAASKPEISANWNASFGRMELTNPQGMSMFVTQDTLSCKSKKTDIEDGIFKIEYIVESDSLLYYKTTLPDGDSPYWHFFASFEIDGRSYNFENNPLVEFTEKEVKYMTEIAANICKPSKMK